MRVVVDTNILVRAIIRPQGSVGPVLLRLRQGDRLLQRGRKTATGNEPVAGIRYNALAVPHDTAFLEDQADEALGRAGVTLGRQRGATGHQNGLRGTEGR